jgi:hypothetical protein
MIEPTPTVVVFGLDPDGNPRAAKFSHGNTELAIKAASLLGYHVARISDLAIAARLREGNVFARGGGFVGRVKRALFDSIVALAGQDQGERAGVELGTAVLW